MTEAPPLADYRVVGLRENWYSPVPEVKQPGGSCWHCGTGIAIEVVIRSKVTGEEHTIGTTCAERVGLDGPELKAMLADRFAEQRAEQARTRTKAYREERARLEAEQVALHGEHGTVSRYWAEIADDWVCDKCLAVAPHGTFHRFWNQDCRCLDCNAAAVANDPTRLVYSLLSCVVDIDTGDVVPAKIVDTRYGIRWCVDDGRAWLAVHPKRRSTQAKHGYVQAEAVFLAERIHTRQGGVFYKRLAQVSSPIVDEYAEPIVHA